MSVSKRDVMKVISNQLSCDESCPYSDFCPRMLDSLMSSEASCLIRLNYETEFDRFYNLYFGESEGLRNEMRASAYRIARSSISPDEILTYFNTINKMSTAFYAPEKTGKADEITTVNILFDNISNTNDKVSNTNEEDSK